MAPPSELAAAVPAEIARSLLDMVVTVAVDVDLLGLTVSIPAFTMDTSVVRRPVHAYARLRVDVDAWPARVPREEVCVQWPRGNRSVG